jgi:hypothetical protein
MEPKTISASSIKAFEDCPAGYNAMYIEQAREASGAAGDLGTALHEAIQGWTVDDLMPIEPGENGEKLLLDRFESKAAALGLPSEMHEAGIKMLKKFYTRIAAEPPYTILQAEVKETFPLKVDGHKINVTFIWDRCDQWEDGSIEVVDYKSWFQSMDAATMKRVLQVRIYALAAAIKFKHLNPPAIWVTLDQLRYDQPVSVKFTREDHRDTYEYLKDVARRIFASDGKLETVNVNCRYCIRRDSCVTLRKVLVASPEHILANGDPEDVALRAAELDAAIKAAEASKQAFADWIESWLEEREIPEYTFENAVTIKFSPTNRRKVDSERVSKVVGPEITAQYGHFSMEDIDGLLKGDEITAKQKDEIKALIRMTTTTRPVATFKKK